MNKESCSKMDKIDYGYISSEGAVNIYFIYNTNTGQVMLHRLDGPAIEYKDGTGKYYVNGKRLLQNEFEQYLKMRAFW